MHKLVLHLIGFEEICTVLKAYNITDLSLYSSSISLVIQATT